MVVDGFQGVPGSLYKEVLTALTQESQLSGTANVVSNGGIMLDVICGCMSKDLLRM